MPMASELGNLITSRERAEGLMETEVWLKVLRGGCNLKLLILTPRRINVIEEPSRLERVLLLGASYLERGFIVTLEEQAHLKRVLQIPVAPAAGSVCPRVLFTAPRHSA